MIFVSSWSFVYTLSRSPSQSLHVRNFSTIHAAIPAGESDCAMPSDIGLVLCTRL
jgi:hypothetical protein